MARIVHVLNDLSTFHTHRKSLIDTLSADNEVIVLVPEHQDHSTLVHAGYTVVSYPVCRKGLNPIQDWRTLQSLKAIYTRYRPEAVHHFTIKPVIYGSLAAQSVGVPIILNSITGLGYVFTGAGLLPRLIRPMVLAMYRRALRHPRVTAIFQNSDDRKLFCELGLVCEKQTIIVPGSGVDIARFRPTPEPPAPPWVVTLPARMLWDKGVGEFVEAARILNLQRQDIEFRLVGGQDPQNRMSIPVPTLEAWEREGTVKYLGHQNHMAKVYEESHIVCLPSYREGLPMSLLEASACGRAIVTTDVPGCRDVVSPDALVPPYDASGLAKKLNLMLSDAVTRRALAERNLEYCHAHFSTLKVNGVICQLTRASTRN